MSIAIGALLLLFWVQARKRPRRPAIFNAKSLLMIAGLVALFAGALAWNALFFGAAVKAAQLLW